MIGYFTCTMHKSHRFLHESLIFLDFATKESFVVLEKCLVIVLAIVEVRNLILLALEQLRARLKVGQLA